MALVSNDELWRRWARDRGLYDASGKSTEQLVHDYRTASDAYAHWIRAAWDEGTDPTTVAARATATDASRDEYGRLQLIEDALNQRGWHLDPWVDGPYPDLVGPDGQVVSLPSHPPSLGATALDGFESVRPPSPDVHGGRPPHGSSSMAPSV